MSQTEASPKAVLELTKSIATSIKTIRQKNEDLRTQLKRLGITFLDDGYSTVTACINNVQRSIEAAEPELNTLAGKMINYAELLQQSKREL